MSTVYIRAEDICIESDEDGFCLFITDEDSGNSIRVNIQHFVLDFYKNVQAEIRPYVLEADSARNAVAAGVPLEEYLDSGYSDEQASGYALDDPKHPTFHERLADSIDRNRDILDRLGR